MIRYPELKGRHDFDVVRNNWPVYKKTVYIGGRWDCFGAGHVELLRRARSAIPSEDVLLLVGIWSAEVSTIVEDHARDRPTYIGRQ